MNDALVVQSKLFICAGEIGVGCGAVYWCRLKHRAETTGSNKQEQIGGATVGRINTCSSKRTEAVKTVDTEEKIEIRNLNGLIDAAIEIGRERRDVLQRMKVALESGNDAEALRFARQLCGLEDETGG